jgi:very-short-patch-repair endonuclease
MTDRATVIRARKLRRIMTSPEVRLWQYLRTSPEGLKFSRQHPVGRFVLDFYCPSARTAIEVDGLVHDMGDNRSGTKCAMRGWRSRRSQLCGSQRGM